MLIKPKLFNVEGGEDFSSTPIINGNPVGVSNLNQQRYGWVNPLYRTMVGNFWLPQKVSLAEDRVTIKTLTDDEDTAFRDTLSFLIFLDSFQTNNLPNIVEYITNPGVKNLIHIQTFQEVIHSESYQYILESLYPSLERDEIYNHWRDNEVLRERNEAIAFLAEKFVNNPSEETFIEVLCANLVLEGIYFYQGFNFFDQLAHRNKAVQTDNVISYIRVDELTHVSLFVNILKDFDKSKIEKPLIKITEMAVKQEIEWCKHTYGNRILGISEKSSEQYVKHLANSRITRLGFEELYSGIENPYQHIDIAQKAGGKRGNFFESGAITEYDTADSVDGWDDL